MKIACIAARILAALTLLAAVGCAQQPQQRPVPVLSLWDTSWRLADLAGSGVVASVSTTLEFPAPDKVTGNASCNRYSGAVQIKAETITFGKLASTRMACGPDIDEQELRFLQALASAERLAFEREQLLIFTKAGNKPLRFNRIK